MSNDYYETTGTIKSAPGHIKGSNVKIINSGTGTIPIFKFTPGLDGTVSGHLLSINAFAFTDENITESDNLKHFRSKIYIIRRATSSTLVQSFDEAVDDAVGEFSYDVSAFNPYEYTLYIDRHATLPRQITVVVEAFVSNNTVNSTFVEFPTDV